MRGRRLQGRRAGLALILVLTILFAFALIATPFVLSMIMHAKTAAVEKSRRQAGYGAEGVRNFAASRLYRGADHFERADSGATPYLDEPGEFDVEIRDARLKALNVRDPQGAVWGVTARDEQGKINVLSAPGRVSATLRTSLGPKVNDLKELLTVYSGRPARWVRPQKIRAIGIFGNPDDPAGPRLAGVRVDNVIQMGLGVRLRASKPGLPPFEAQVIRNGASFIGVNGVETNPRIPEQYLDGILEIEMRHPVNVNTARRETLTAIHDGLALCVPSSRGSGTRVHQVGPLEAGRVADGLYQKGIATWDRFLCEALRLEVDDYVKAAVIINALDPGNLLLNDRREGRGTVGLCFTSNETVTIEAMASINSAAGTPRGGMGFREVVDLGGPDLFTRSWENQFDFDRMMGPPRLMVSAGGTLPPLPESIAAVLRHAGILGTGYAGYPFGSRMETFPMDLERGDPSDMTLKAHQKSRPNYVSMRTERDHRGRGAFIRTVEHFDKELDGLRIDRAAFSKKHPEAFAAMPGRPDAAAGGTEFWIRFEDDLNPFRPVRLFDIRETDETNRISISVQNGLIIYRITDATIGTNTRFLDKGWSEIRAPFVPKPDTWYHIAAYWKGTRYGEMALMIDGFIPTGSEWRYLDTDGRKVQSTELASMLLEPGDPDAPYTIIPLKDNAWTVRPPGWPADRPWTVPIRIGSEVIEYDPESGVGRRGSRTADTVYGRSAAEHPADAKVSLFGYTSVLRNHTVQLEFPFGIPPGSIAMNFGPIRATRGAAAHRFGLCRNMFLVGEKRSKSSGNTLGKGAQRVNFQILSDLPADTSEWPDSGFIRIENEAIYYRQIVRETKTTGYFNHCERGRADTEDVDHLEGVPIELWGVAVTEPDLTLPNPTLIQFGEEWFGPVQLAQVPGGGPANFYWIGCTIEGLAISLARGRSWGTEPAHHEVGERLVPIFAAREPDPAVLRTNLRTLDPVTAIESTNYREQHRICHATTVEELNYLRFMVDPLATDPPGLPSTPPPPPKVRALQGIQLASFFEPTKRDFPVDGLHNRIMKWPSGELIGERYLALKNPSVLYGPAGATLDEVKNVASPKAPLELAAIADRESPEVRMTSSPELDGHSTGLLLVGEELIGYPKRAWPDVLLYCARGWLNSIKDVHDRGDAAFLLSFLPVAALNESSLTPVSRRMATSQELAGPEFTRGYVLVNDEVIGFEERGESGKDLDSLARFDGTGLFRGMFGTTPAPHPIHSMVFGIPFRYWDGYKRGEFDNRMPYFQAAHTTRDARWRGLRLAADVDSRDPNLRPLCLVRIDGIGDLALPLVDDHSAVWRFEGAGGHSLEDCVSGRLENGQVEARVFLDYARGSYWPEDSWKRTMKIHEIRIDYDRDTKVVLHQD